MSSYVKSRSPVNFTTDICDDSLRILVVWRSLDNIAGGAERMMIQIANAMSDRGHLVEILSSDDNSAECFYPLDSKVTWHKLGVGNPTKRTSLVEHFRKAYAVRRVHRSSKPHVVLAFEASLFLTYSIYLFGLDSMRVIAERNSLRRLDFPGSGERKSRVIMALRLADRIIVQFPRYKNDYPRKLHQKIHAIPNPIKLNTLNDSPSANDRETTILAVGRLTYQKSFETLISAFSMLSKEHSSWKLVLVGSGPQRGQLLRQVKQLQLEDRIEILEPIEDIRPLYRKSGVFCLPSRWEGFPNVLAEAMTFQMPCVGFADCPGVSDLITDHETGLLASGIEDPKTLSRALSLLIRSSPLRDRIGLAARASLIKYNSENIYAIWEEFFLGVAKRH